MSSELAVLPRFSCATFSKPFPSYTLLSRLCSSSYRLPVCFCHSSLPPDPLPSSLPASNTSRSQPLPAFSVVMPAIFCAVAPPRRAALTPLPARQTCLQRPLRATLRRLPLPAHRSPAAPLGPVHPAPSDIRQHPPRRRGDGTDPSLAREAGRGDQAPRRAGPG